MDIASLEQSLDQHQSQLQEIETLILSASGEDLENLKKLASDVRELLTLTKQSIELITPGNGSEQANDIDPFELEYARLKAELGEFDSTASEVEPVNREQSSSVNGETEVRLDEIPELLSLEGQKCRAPFSHSWGELGYHNAMILSVEPVDVSEGAVDIKVRVLYLLPTHESMKTCKYYLDAKCHYGPEECRYSHGKVVSLQSLRDYEEPDFSHLTEGSKILCRYENNELWYPSSVRSVKGDKLTVRYDAYPGEDVEVAIEDVWPLERGVTFDESDDEGYENHVEPQAVTEDEDLEIVRTDFLLGIGASSALGEWEKHTKGFGSKMMMKLGYVMGAGLGNKGQGRIEPVDAVVLPPGRSLDRCMELKEKGDGQNLLSVEKRLKRQQAAAAKKEARRLAREEASENHFKSLFDVLNSRLAQVHEGDKKPLASTGKANKKHLKKETSKNLNIQGFQVSEEIRKAENDLKKLKESLSRQLARNDRKAAENVERQIRIKEDELHRLRMSEKAINHEKDSRTSQKKMVIF